jgi:hypothetical protein
MKGALLIMGAPKKGGGDAYPKAGEKPGGGDKHAAVTQAAKEFMSSPSCDSFSALMDLYEDYKSGMAEESDTGEE